MLLPVVDSHVRYPSCHVAVVGLVKKLRLKRAMLPGSRQNVQICVTDQTPMTCPSRCFVVSLCFPISVCPLLPSLVISFSTVLLLSAHCDITLWSLYQQLCHVCELFCFQFTTTGRACTCMLATPFLSLAMTSVSQFKVIATLI